MKNNDRKKARERTRLVTLSGLFVALGVVIMYLGSFIETLDLTVSVVVSLFCVMAVIEMGGGWPFGIYAATSILSLLLLPNKLPATVYLLFAGYYPMIKEKLEKKLGKKFVCYIIKVVIFNAAFAAVMAATVLVLKLPAESGVILWATVALGNVTFLLYDIALTRLITVYFRMIRPRLTFLNKK